MEVKFLTDSSLGRLSKWLRLLGFDTVYHRGPADRAFLRVAEREGRVVLTRRRDVLAQQRPGTVLFVDRDRVEDQIAEVLRKLDITPDPDAFFTMCLECNVPLNPAERESVQNRIPDYVYRTQREFRSCPGCGRVYWPGTHRERAMEMLQGILGADME